MDNMMIQDAGINKQNVRITFGFLSLSNSIALQPCI